MVIYLFPCSFGAMLNMGDNKSPLRTGQRAAEENVNIELGYCCIQLLAALFTIFRGLGLVGVTLILLVTFAYILYINPKS